MERQKLLHEYTEEELLKLLGEPTSEVTTSNEEDQIKNDVVRFVLFYDIKPGEENVNSKLLCEFNRVSLFEIDHCFLSASFYT